MTETLEDLYQRFASEEQIKDSFERRTLPTGKYVLRVKKVDARTLPETFTHAGKPVLTVSGDLFDAEGNKKGRAPMFDISYERLLKPDGKQEAISSLYGQAATALDMRNKSAGDIRDGLLAYPVSVYVREAFKTPEGWRTARTPEERAELRKAGFDAKNFIQSISRA